MPAGIIVLEMKQFYNGVMCFIDEDGTAGRVDPDKNRGAVLMWICTVCSDLSVTILTIFMVGHIYLSKQVPPQF